ncbi:MAG: PEP-CTERM sorting domain-containing protein [Patescibacteria group bacterium]
MRMRKCCVFLFAFFLLTVVGAGATTIDLVGHNYEYNKGVVNFNYSYLESGYGQIDLSVQNESEYEPSITGFAFNAPHQVTGLHSFTGSAGWAGFFEPNNINTPESFGLFDVAGSVCPVLEGGNPHFGIQKGETTNFGFQVSGNDLDTLNEASFLEELSYVPSGNGESVSFIARIQSVGENKELSDVMVPKKGSMNPIPEPATMLLFGTGLLFCAAVGRKKKK